MTKLTRYDAIHLQPTASATHIHVKRNSDFTAVDTAEVVPLIQQSSSKQCLLDPAPTWLIKLCADLLGPYVTVLVIHPLLKKPGLDPTLPSNYRPVSNLQFLSKLIE